MFLYIEIGFLFYGILTLLITILCFFLFYGLNKITNWEWFCINLNWHKKPKEIEKEVIFKKGICPRCGKNVTQRFTKHWLE